MQRVISMFALLVVVFAAEFLSLKFSFASHEPWVQVEYPQDKDKKTWWDDDWWDNGTLDVPENYAVSRTRIEYKSGDTEVPAYLFRPKKPGKYLPVLFQHGRRGLDDLTLRHPKRLAARGFIVLAPDVWNARFIDKYPLEHDYAVEADVARGIEVLLQQPDIKGDKTCVVSHTRGGYLTLKALVTHKKQDKEVVCYVSYYPHWQDPNKPEPMQIYQYAPEIDKLKVPVLVFIGEHDQYQRVRSMMEGIKALTDLKRKPRLIVYPGVGRGFDFRAPKVRTFADDLAAKDAMRRAEKFIRNYLEK